MLVPFATRLMRASRAMVNLSKRSMAAPPKVDKAKFMLVTNNEDFRVEYACLNRFNAPANSLRMAMVTGGADTTLTALMHPSVGYVLSFDTSPLQLHLLRLKLAVAISDLNADEAAGFLLRGEGGKAVFTAKLAEQLPKDTLDFFETAGEDEIELGILRADNDVPFNKILRSWFAEEKGIDLTGWRSMSVTEKEHVLSICATNEVQTLTLAIQTFFKAAPWFQAMPKENQEVLLSVLGVAATSTLRGTGKILADVNCGILPQEDFFMDVVLSGSPKTLPPWLTESGRGKLRTKMAQGPALETVQSRAEDLKDMDKFDLVSLSNIYDFSDEEASIASVKGVVASALKPNGELLVRRAVGSAPHILKQAGGKQLEGEALENYDINPLFYQGAGTVASAKFA
eukprot:TRINITY_DN40521_c0_g1_i1.p1 TRINITY_DN40521_c0_g1~~TRINITY_DN40521_c0_g1_i1.p1  ORF type:complete len:399 (-),score=94.38 TRINITY_DN40521_c0_g1_i1:159-1355(-)